MGHRDANSCPECHNQFEGRMPGHKYGSNWDWVPCQTCGGSGTAPGGDAVEGAEDEQAPGGSFTMPSWMHPK